MPSFSQPVLLNNLQPRRAAWGPLEAFPGPWASSGRTKTSRAPLQKLRNLMLIWKLTAGPSGAFGGHSGA
eukprot:7745222-Pyramimonas_sp.AAC.1